MRRRTSGTVKGITASAASRPPARISFFGASLAPEPRPAHGARSSKGTEGVFAIQNRPYRQLYKTLLCFDSWLLTALLALETLALAFALAEVRIDPREIVTLLPKDAIPPIRNPKPLLVLANEEKGVRDTDQVLGVNMGGESRA